jgi:hypothetical protein
MTAQQRTGKLSASLLCFRCTDDDEEVCEDGWKAYRRDAKRRLCHQARGFPDT